MFTLGQKIEVIAEFLVNRAQLQRVTNFQEIGRVAGEKLLEKGYRNYSSEPVSRSDVALALSVIAQNSHSENAILLPALVEKFWTAEPTHEFALWASNAGLMQGSLESCEDGPVRDQIKALQPQEKIRVFEFYATVPSDLSALQA